MDVYRPTAVSETLSPVVLLWHGRGPDERDVLAPLARAAASLGVVCFVPDWRPDADDGGRSHLRESALFVRRNAAEFGGDAGRIVLAGWSLGANAVTAAALDPDALDGWRPQAVVGIAGAYTRPQPLTGRAPLDVLAEADRTLPDIPVRLVHGTADTLVAVRQSREFHAALQRQGRPASLDESDADHAGVIMAEYDPESQRCRPSRSPGVVEAGMRTVRRIVEAAPHPRTRGPRSGH
ncbi:alpha/beta hydrolase [Streptomyces roseicoloratus]|uniref:alpha/beta hydrolase n=1 Tax=Streptomyces roseicoloratus TaxID=2508722 RepID=UPI0013E958C4|nr:alpha/beta hydrolase [Streptomyces roseicoloratus]